MALADPVAVMWCPKCHGDLESRAASLVCSSCLAVFPREGRVTRFIDDNEFYEGTYLNHLGHVPDGRPLSELRFYLINTHYLWWVRKWVPPGGRLLELGCGGGVRFFAKHARVTAVDLSRKSLSLVDEQYENAVQADALALPLRTGQFDGVASSYFFEHIPNEQKEALLAELRRVVRPGGRVVFLFDVESHNPLFRLLRSDDARYRSAIVENDRHYGLEPASVNLKRFERAGFRVLDLHAANKTLVQHAPAYVWLRDFPYLGTKALHRLGVAVGRHGAVAKAYTGLVTLFDDVVEPFFPLDWSRILLIALERT